MSRATYYMLHATLSIMWGMKLWIDLLLALQLLKWWNFYFKFFGIIVIFFINKDDSLIIVFFQDHFQTETLLTYFLGNPFHLGYFHVSEKSSIPNRAEKVIL